MGAPLGVTSSVLGRVEKRLKPAYDVMKITNVALGAAPISFASTAVSGLLRVAIPNHSGNKSVEKSISHAGLAADGIARGLFYSGGLLHGAVAPRLPWLVTSRGAPPGLVGFASGLGKVTHYARIGLLGIGGVAGAARAAKAVADAGDARALVETKDGRAGVLQAAGSALLIVKHPATYLLGAGVFAAAIANEFTSP